MRKFGQRFLADVPKNGKNEMTADVALCRTAILHPEESLV